MRNRFILKKFSRKVGINALALSVWLGGFSPPAMAEGRQYKIEAAFLYSFFNYITWPGQASPQSLINPVICIYGNDPIIDYLNYVRLKMSSERLLTTRSILDGDIISDCNILFMRHRIPYRMMTSLSTHTLTVLKPDDPLDRGSMIELYDDEERIRIRINQSQLEQNGFQASSRLLELAQIIK